MTVAAITGITGLAGGHVAQALQASGHEVLGISRRAPTPQAAGTIRSVPDLLDVDALTSALNGSGIVFHFADRADRKSYGEADVNTAAQVMGAIRKAAFNNGIRRIVAFSSVYADRPDQPGDLYGRSKRAMEAAAMDQGPGPQAVVLRLPPLYGPGARGAVRHIANACAKGWPLPFGLAHAPRRFLSLDALAHLCTHLAEVDDTRFERAAGHVLVPISPRSNSLASLSRTIGGNRIRLVPVPGIDRILGGRVPREQLGKDRQAMLDAIGWVAP